MKNIINDAKCPYCRAVFKTSAFGSKWAQCLWGEYASSETTHICPQCGKESIVAITQITRYSARKISKQ